MSPDPAAHPIQLPAEFRHLWLFFVAGGVFNLAVLGRQFRRRSAERPDLAAGYWQCLTGYSAFLLLPWLLMGYGIEIGGVPNVFSFLRTPGGNPYIFAFNAVFTVLFVVLFIWMYLYRGAEFLLAHPGTLGRNASTNPVVLRAYSALALAGWLIVLVLRWKHLLPEFFVV